MKLVLGPPLILLTLAMSVEFAAFEHAMALSSPMCDIEWVTVGDAGNVADFGGFGSVGYAFEISKHEVTNCQWAEFLNAVDPDGTNTYALWDSQMSSESVGGIDQVLGNPAGSKYVVKGGREHNPVVFVDWFSCLRFCNWLHNGQGAGDSEDGAYDMSVMPPLPRPEADYFLPSEDEWYKAVHYDPIAEDYFFYATGTNSPPTSEPPAGGTNSANCWDPTTGYALTGSITFDPAFNYLTDVGAYTSSASPYGTFDQCGNVIEWIEDEFIPGSGIRVFRGGSWFLTSVRCASGNPGAVDPDARGSDLGFRPARSSCTAADGLDLVLSDDSVVSVEVVEVCRTLILGPNYTVAASGDLTLRAGKMVVFENGFSVAAGGTLAVEIDESLRETP